MHFKLLDTRELMNYKPMRPCAVKRNRHKWSNNQRFISVIGSVSNCYACNQHSAVEYMTEFIYSQKYFNSLDFPLSGYSYQTLQGLFFNDVKLSNYLK